MDDKRIIQLFFARSERAIAETAEKYGSLLFGVSYRILASAEDAEECVDDAYMRTWNAIPPTVPHSLSAYLCGIVRNLSFDRYRQNKRRTSFLISEITDELCSCVPDSSGDVASDIALRDALNDFLSSLGETQRIIFVKRYFFALSVREIARQTRESESNVKTVLSRLRVKLKQHLENRQITL